MFETIKAQHCEESGPAHFLWQDNRVDSDHSNSHLSDLSSLPQKGCKELPPWAKLAQRKLAIHQWSDKCSAGSASELSRDVTHSKNNSRKLFEGLKRKRRMASFHFWKMHRLDLAKLPSRHISWRNTSLPSLSSSIPCLDSSWIFQVPRTGQIVLASQAQA